MSGLCGARLVCIEIYALGLITTGLFGAELCGGGLSGGGLCMGGLSGAGFRRGGDIGFAGAVVGAAGAALLEVVGRWKVMPLSNCCCDSA